MNLRASVAKLFSGSLLGSVIQFGAIVGFTQALGPGPVGSFFVFQALVGLLGVPVNLGIARAAEKHLSANEPPGEVIATAVLTQFCLALPWVGALVLARSQVESYVGVPGILPLVVLGLLVGQYRRLALRVLAGQLRVEYNAALKVLGRVVWVVGGFALVAAGWGATGIVASFVLGNVATILGVVVRMDRAVAWPRLDRARELVDFGRYVFIGDVGGYIYQWMDVAILRLFVPVGLVGAYEIAWRVASISMLLTKAIRTTLFPQISNWYEDDRIEAIESAFYRWVQLPLYLTIPAFAGAVVLGEDVLRTLFGAEVAVAYPVLVVFMLEKILRSVQLVIGPALFAMDKPHLGYRGSAAAIVTNLTLNFALIPTFGLIGAATATTLGAATAAAVAIGYVRGIVDIRVPWSRIAWSVGASALMAAGVFAVRAHLPDGLAGTLLGVGTGVAIYLLLLLANDGIRLDVRSVVRDYRES